MKKLRLSDEARKYIYVREAETANTGLRVEAIQHWSGGNKGDSWCMEFAWMVIDICYQGDAPIDRMQAVQDLYQKAKDEGWIVDDPQPDDLVLSINDADHAHHVGIVTNKNPLSSIAGNTSEDGVSSNGDRVAEHAISAANKKFVRLPTE